MEPTSFIKASKERIENFLDKYIPIDDQEDSLLKKAMRYSTLSGGKRIRAALIYSLEEPLGISHQISDILAGSIECIHAASLVHDDLPALDNDNLRRSQLSCHMKFGEAAAILCGDALLMEGMGMVLNMPQDMLPSQTILDLAKRLSRAISVHGIMEGQMQDLHDHPSNPTVEKIEDIYFKKTCLLLGVGLELMVIAAGQESFLMPVQTCMKHLGLGYQIQDDILDFEASTLTGKTQYSDLKSKKNTLVSKIGSREAKARVKFHFQQVNSILNDSLACFQELKQIILYIQKRKQ